MSLSVLRSVSLGVSWMASKRRCAGRFAVSLGVSLGVSSGVLRYVSFYAASAELGGVASL